jgi:hypothetical protein
MMLDPLSIMSQRFNTALISLAVVQSGCIQCARRVRHRLTKTWQLDDRIRIGNVAVQVVRRGGIWGDGGWMPAISRRSRIEKGYIERAGWHHPTRGETGCGRQKWGGCGSRKMDVMCRRYIKKHHIFDRYPEQSSAKGSCMGLRGLLQHIGKAERGSARGSQLRHQWFGSPLSNDDDHVISMGSWVKAVQHILAPLMGEQRWGRQSFRLLFWQ